jgi:cation:H+ antiporter
VKSIAILVISLGIILLGAEVFVNGIEWLGKKLNLSEGAVGSVLAAVGTALPETLIPIIAIVFSDAAQGHEIGIGAILGAPLMLATLAMCVTGIAVVIFRRRRAFGVKVVADYYSMSRDLGFFILVYAAAVLAGLIPPHYRAWQVGIGVIMVLAYCIYVVIMLFQERDIHADHQLPQFYLARSNPSPPLVLVVVQVLLALGFIILGAHMFVGSVTDVAEMYAVPAFVLALIITPIATELPEKFNSIIWVSRSKDTLALGNITGAMVFQSSLIPALGIFLTPWQLTHSALIVAVLAIASASFIFWELRKKKHISALMLIVGGLFYALFIYLVGLGIVR